MSVVPADTSPRQVALLPEPDTLTPMQMLQIAVSRGVDTEQIKALMELQREWKADRAAEAFNEAMNAFRKETLEVKKTKAVKFKTDGPTAYRHALLSDAVAIVAPALSKHGLSHRWETKQDGSAITVTCVVTHELGHSISNSLTAPPDMSGSKNSIQAIGSTVSYLQRYTFLSITGLAAKDDDDGRGGATDPTITEGQAAGLEILMDEVGIVGQRRASLLKSWRIDSVDQLLAKNYQTAVDYIEGKRQ